MYIKEIGWEDVDWINLEHDRTKWRAVVNTVMFLTGKGLCSKEFRCLRLYGGRSLVNLKCYMQITFLKLLRVCFSYLASLSLKTHKIIIVTAV